MLVRKIYKQKTIKITSDNDFKIVLLLESVEILLDAITLGNKLCWASPIHNNYCPSKFHFWSLAEEN